MEPKYSDPMLYARSPSPLEIGSQLDHFRTFSNLEMIESIENWPDDLPVENNFFNAETQPPKSALCSPERSLSPSVPSVPEPNYHTMATAPSNQVVLATCPTYEECYFLKNGQSQSEAVETLESGFNAASNIYYEKFGQQPKFDVLYHENYNYQQCAQAIGPKSEPLHEMQAAYYPAPPQTIEPQLELPISRSASRAATAANLLKSEPPELENPSRAQRPGAPEAGNGGPVRRPGPGRPRIHADTRERNRIHQERNRQKKKDELEKLKYEHSTMKKFIEDQFGESALQHLLLCNQQPVHGLTA